LPDHNILILCPKTRLSPNQLRTIQESRARERDWIMYICN
jgi:hypothetical protein